MRRMRAFTLLELLVAIAIVATLASLLVPALQRLKTRVHRTICAGNLKQWGFGFQMYAAENDDLMPPEGFGLNSGWYITLPPLLGMPTYLEVPWRTNPEAVLPHSIWICPGNTNRSNGNNLFHYCLNKNVDGTGGFDVPTRVGSIRRPSEVVWMFDNGRRAAVAQQNNVHTNAHSEGAQFVFVDGHVAWFRNVSYWDFQRGRGLTNNPWLIWIP